MEKLTYTRKTSLILHNEYYTNIGLTQKDMIQEIKKIESVYIVKEFPINSNIEVCISGNSISFIEDVINDIEITLEYMALKLNLDKNK